jgi:hypothetical protein
MAAQLIATNALPARGLSECTARASTSLPVPLSPSSSTVAMVGATFSMMRQMRIIESLIAMTPASGMLPGWRASARVWASRECMYKARWTISRRTSLSTGFW